ncbi:hypothetical protein ES703_120338 [subsurface metagenome]
MLGRRLHCQGFMGPFLVVLGPEPVKGPLLGVGGGLGWLGGGLLQGPVHPFVSAIFLGMSRPDALWADTQAHPPYRQARQPAQAHRGEGWTVVGANRPRQAKLLKGGGEHRLDSRSFRSYQPLAAQQIPAGHVSDGQRIDPGSILRPKPSLEVSAPHLVRLDTLLEWLIIGRGVTFASAGRRQATALQKRPHCARRRPMCLGLDLSQSVHQLARPPVGVLSPKGHDLFFHLPRYAIGVPSGRSAAVAQSRRSFRQVACQPLVTGLPADPIKAAQLGQAPLIL